MALAMFMAVAAAALMAVAVLVAVTAAATRGALGLRNLARKESIHDVVAIACRTGIDIDTGLSESVNSPATNTAANKHVNASCRKHASESAMTGTV